MISPELLCGSDQSQPGAGERQGALSAGFPSVPGSSHHSAPRYLCDVGQGDPEPL